MGFGLPGVLYLDEQPDNFDFIVVSPQAFPNVPWWELDSLATLNALLEEVIANYRVDESRVYLTGLSMEVMALGLWPANIQSNLPPPAPFLAVVFAHAPCPATRSFAKLLMCPPGPSTAQMTTFHHQKRSK